MNGMLHISLGGIFNLRAEMFTVVDVHKET